MTIATRTPCPPPVEAVSRVEMLTDPPPVASPGPLRIEAAAILLALDGHAARISHDGQVSAARVAFGCVIRPEPGDLILTVEADGTRWIVAVLDRPSDAPARVWADGDFTLSAGGTLHLESGARVRVAAPAIDLHAAAARFILDRLVHVGTRIDLYVTRIRKVADAIETFASHVLTRARRVDRFVAESDQLRAGDIDHRADGNLLLSARAAFVTAETVVRVDAEQIHMG